MTDDPSGACQNGSMPEQAEIRALLEQGSATSEVGVARGLRR